MITRVKKRNINFKQRFVGPFKHKASKKIEMDKIRNDSGKLSFIDDKNFKSDSYSNSDSFLFNEIIKRKTSYKLNAKKAKEDSRNDSSIEEINFINKIKF